jgi:hypothetical protein
MLTRRWHNGTCQGECGPSQDQNSAWLLACSPVAAANTIPMKHRPGRIAARLHARAPNHRTKTPSSATLPTQDGVHNQPTCGTRSWAFTSAAVTGCAGSWSTVATWPRASDPPKRDWSLALEKNTLVASSGTAAATNERFGAARSGKDKPSCNAGGPRRCCTEPAKTHQQQSRCVGQQAWKRNGLTLITPARGSSQEQTVSLRFGWAPQAVNRSLHNI